jgi:succinate-acetate transporter protein
MRVNDAIPARVFLRPIGAPLTIGMSGLAIASLVQSGLDLHWIARTQGKEVGLILVAVPFVLQVLACVLTYLARDGAAGASLGVLATSWLAIGLIHLVSKPGETSGALGLLVLSAAGALVLSAIAVYQAKPLPAAVFLLASVRFALAGVYQLSTTGAWQDAAGIIGLVVSAIAGYCLLAFELESQKGVAVIPTFRHGRGRAAISGGPGAQIDGVIHEAGVRQTS